MWSRHSSTYRLPFTVFVPWTMIFASASSRIGAQRCFLTGTPLSAERLLFGNMCASALEPLPIIILYGSRGSLNTVSEPCHALVSLFARLFSSKGLTGRARTTLRLAARPLRRGGGRVISWVAPINWALVTWLSHVISLA